MKAIRVHEPGGPEVMRYEEIPDPIPGTGEALVKIEATGVNYIDIYRRSGLIGDSLPMTCGQEAAGVVESIGADVSTARPGDRVAYEGTVGSYAELAIVPSEKLVPLPSNVDSKTAASVLLQGMTAQYLSHTTYPLGKNHTVLVHAAAGGVGLLLVQMAKRLGTHVIGTVSSEAKAEQASGAGADEVIIYTEVDFLSEVMRLTNGAGLQVVYDSVGLETFDKSLKCLAPRGHLVLYGHSSGLVPDLELQRLQTGGSLFVTRPSLVHYTLTRDELLNRASDVLDRVGTGELDVRIDSVRPVADAGEAHRRLESRASIGKLILVP